MHLNPNLFFLILPVLLIFSVAILYFLRLTPKIPERLIIADGQQPVFSLIYIADKKGYFKKENLEITYRKFYSGKAALDDMLAGNADLSMVYETPVVRKIYEGNKISIITSLHQSTQNTALVGLKSHGIQSVKDLKGKKIGVPKGTSSEFFLYLLLLSEGIDRSMIVFVNMPSEELPKALNLGTVDAVASFNAQSTIKDINPNLLTIIRSDIYTEMSMLVGNDEFVSQNTQKMIKLLKALRKAEEFQTANPAETISLTDDWLPNYDYDEVKTMFELSNIDLKLDNILLTVLKREGEFFYDIGEYKQPEPNFREYIKGQYLRSVSPKKVTIF